MVSRRGFLKLLGGATVMSTGGIALMSSRCVQRSNVCSVTRPTDRNRLHSAHVMAQR